MSEAGDIETRDPEDLTPHPKNSEIYGDNIDQSFIDRIEKHGIQSKVKVTSESHFTDAELTIIGGHRRVAAAKELGRPVEIEEVGPYETPEEEIEALLVDNDHRDKTPAQEIREVDQWAEVYRESPKLETDSAIEAASEHVSFGASTYWDGKKVQNAAKEGEWGRRNPKHLPDEIIETARTWWDRLESGEATIGGAHSEVKIEVDRYEQRKAREADRDSSADDTSEPPRTKGEYQFLPSLGPNEMNLLKARYERTQGKITSIGDKELNWWEDQAIIPSHPYILVNPFSFPGIDPDREDLLEIMRFPDGMYVFSDSGGYQLMKKEGVRIVETPEEHDFEAQKVYPEKLVEWQFQNADAGATLDVPPYQISGGPTPDSASIDEDWRNMFTRRMERSAEYASRMSIRLEELREDRDEYAFCPVIHGQPDLDHDDVHHLVHLWYTSIEDQIAIEPDAWVLKPDPASDLGMIAFWLGFAAEYLQKVDHIHVLQVGSLTQKTLLMWYAMLTEQRVTSDASTYAGGGMRREFSIPFTRRSIRITNREASPIERWPCRCQVCSTVEEEYGIEFITEETGNAQSSALNLHHLNMALTEDTTVWGLLENHFSEVSDPNGSASDTEFWRFMGQWLGQGDIMDLKRAFSYVYLAYTEGLQIANDRYEIQKLSKLMWELEMNTDDIAPNWR